VAWDTVARQDFHTMVAVVVDGDVVAAPLIEPGRETFSSYGGRFPVATAWTAAEARRAAGSLDMAALSLRLVRQSQLIVGAALAVRR